MTRDRRYVAELIYESFLAGLDPFAQLSEFDVITDPHVCNSKANYWPALDFDVLRAIRRYHPKCVFILHRRDPQKLVRSISGHEGFRQFMTRSDIIGLPADDAADDDKLRNWIERHYAACAATFSGDPYYLDLDIESEAAPKRLGVALGIELRWWGIANSAEERGRLQGPKRL